MIEITLGEYNEILKDVVHYIKFINNNTIEISYSSPHKNYISKVINCDRVIVDHPHIIINNDIYKLVNESKTYYVQDKTISISDACMDISIAEFIKKENLNKYSRIAEIGVKFASSSKYILENNLSLEYLDLYESNEKVKDVIQERLQSYSNWNLFLGKAERTLRTTETYYDLVFFDCSHKFNSDKRVLLSLWHHIDKDTTIIFDDYKLDDVKQLVDFFINTLQFEGKVIY